MKFDWFFLAIWISQIPLIISRFWLIQFVLKKNLFDSNKYLFGPKIFSLNWTSVSNKSFLWIIKSLLKKLFSLVQSELVSGCELLILICRIKYRMSYHMNCIQDDTDIDLVQVSTYCNFPNFGWIGKWY